MGRDSWCLRGGVVLDIAFGTTYAGDIDLVYEGRRPPDEKVRQLARRSDLTIDAVETVFPRTDDEYILGGYAWTRVTNFDDLRFHPEGTFSLDGCSCERAELPQHLHLVLTPTEEVESEVTSRALVRVWRLRQHVTVAPGVVDRLVAMLKAKGALDRRFQRMAQDIRSAAARNKT